MLDEHLLKASRTCMDTIAATSLAFEMSFRKKRTFKLPPENAFPRETRTF
jgi:hypothetical protein